MVIYLKDKIPIKSSCCAKLKALLERKPSNLLILTEESKSNYKKLIKFSF